MTRRRAIVFVTLLVCVSAAALGIAKRPTQTKRGTESPSPRLIAAHDKAPGPESEFARKLLDRSTLQEQDGFTTPDGERFTVSQGRTKDRAKVCVFTAGRGGAGSACDTPGFTLSPVIWVESFSAGPGGTPVTDWAVSGLAAPNVARLELVDSTGRRRPVHLGRGNAFFVALSHGELKRGVTAVTLDVYAADGSLLTSIAL